MYHEGQGVPQDYAEAVKWFRLAAEQGNADGQYVLGSMYYKGHGVPQDYAEAVKWYRLAAEQGALSEQNFKYSERPSNRSDRSEKCRKINGHEIRF